MLPFEGENVTVYECLCLIFQVAGQSNNNKTDKWPEFQTACDTVLKSFTTAKGKLHLNLHTTLTSNVSKTLQDHYKTSNKTIQTLVGKIQALSDELRKTKQQYQRRIEKYGRLVVEAETTIHTRDALNESLAPRGDGKDRDILSKVKVSTYVY